MEARHSSIWHKGPEHLAHIVTCCVPSALQLTRGSTGTNKGIDLWQVLQYSM